MNKLYNRKKQSKNITEDWKYIRRYNDLEKGVSKSARHILSSVLYQINKYKHAVLTHYELSQITEAKHDQNCNLVKQLGFVLDFQFKRSVVINEKKYRDCYVFFKNENTDKILENPEEYFTKLQRKNSVTSPKKFGDVAEKIRQSPESLHIYNKNKEKIDKNFYLDNLPSHSIEESVETAEPKIANSECAEKSHNGLAKEEFVQSPQAKISAKEDVVTEVSQKEEIFFANQKIISTDAESTNPAFKLLSHFPLTDSLLDQIISKSNKNYHKRDRVIALIRRLIDKNPKKQIYGGNPVFIKYMVKLLDNEHDYLSNSTYSIAEIKKERQAQIAREVARGGITWLD